MAQSRPAPDFRRRLKAANLIRQDLMRHAVGLFAISGVINVLALTGSIYMMQVYDRVLSSGSTDTLLFLSALALALYVFHGGFEAIRSQILVRFGARLDQRLSPLAQQLSIEMPRYGFSTTEAMERGRAIDTLRGFLGSSAPGALFDLPWVPLFLIFVFLLHPALGAVTLAGAVVLAALTVVAEIRSRGLTQAAQQAMVQRNTTAESNARNADALIAMGAVNRAVDRYLAQNADHLATATRAADVAATLSSISRMLRMVLQSGLLGLGAYFALRGQMSAGAIIAVSVASSRALAPIDQVIGNWRNLLGARAAYALLRDAIAAQPEPGKTVDLPLPTGSLRVEGMTVASPATGRVLLADVSFELKAGQALAVIGPSGGGKSTLMRALAGVWQPLRGAVRVDDVSLAHIPQDRMGKIIGYLPQEVNLFAGSILENINRFSEDRASRQVYVAAATAGVHTMISALPDGYDTQVGSAGTALSAGQRQRVGLARALFGDPFVVLLDEPNAALDAAGEKALNETIKIIRDRGGIVVVVAHRPNVLKAVDMVAVVQNGRLAAFGPRDEVLGNKQGTASPPADLVGDGHARAVHAAE
ncbi:type I secretion system permease/ATPase [Gemmobacter nectariphilus]|uniref:type I secretion system permease/ATPase n=1 Tax=Gemmobacter nectariphilus TaxID=220343 RepID=UPI0004025FC4|nr:type I secretion system permease/ATPase [Gemmobacter nectariphilus]